MTNVWIGFTVGFAATVVLSALMWVQISINRMPQMAMIGMLAGMTNSPHRVG
jgi:hypothetical protein